MKTNKMKINRMVTFPGIMIFALLLSTSAMAQPERRHDSRGNGKTDNEKVCVKKTECNHNLPGLTDEQIEKIEALKLKMQKETLALHNQLTEKQARIRTLSTVDNPDTKAINKTIDELSALRGEIQKVKMANRLEIRKLLTDKQRIVFDTRPAGGKGYSRNQQGCHGKTVQGSKPCPNKK